LFNQNFDLSRTLPSVGLYSNFTVDSVNNIVQLRYTNISQASNVQINFTLANVTNPFVTSLFQAINLNVKNNMNLLINQGELSLTYTASTFSLINDWEGYF